MDYQEFKRRVDYNTNVLQNALTDNIPLTMIASEVYTWNNAPGETNFSILMRNMHDIIPSVFLGALASLDNNGIDAYIVQPDNTLEELEIKTSEVASKRVWRGARGGLYTGIGQGKTQKAALTSGLQASYTLHTWENLQSKNMRTVLMVVDTDEMLVKNSYIDAWELTGDAVVEYLGRSNVKQRTIKLGSFMMQGRQSETVVPLMGFEKFRDQLERHAPFRDTWLIENGYL